MFVSVSLFLCVCVRACVRAREAATAGLRKGSDPAPFSSGGLRKGQESDCVRNREAMLRLRQKQGLNAASETTPA